VIRKGSTRRLVRRSWLAQQGTEERYLVALPGGAEDEADDLSDRCPAGLYVRRPRDGGYAARWAMVLASANGDLWARDREPRRPVLQRRRAPLIVP
jgi:hypothetical protein